MFHCNNSGQIVSTKEGSESAVLAIHSRAMEGQCHLASADHNKVPDIREPPVTVPPLPSHQDASVAAASHCESAAGATDSSGPAGAARGRGASPRAGAARPSPLSVIRSAPEQRAVAVLSRVVPRGPATTAGWRLAPWARLVGGGESTGGTGTAGWGAPPPAATGNSAAAGTANWAQTGPPPSQWGSGGRPNGAQPAGAAQQPPQPGAAKNGTDQPQQQPQQGQDQQQGGDQQGQQPAQPAQPGQDGQDQPAAGAQAQNAGEWPADRRSRVWYRGRWWLGHGITAGCVWVMA
ncbi:hypothetical protein FJT64_017701 [Amphibalanus amphitrite]|nr:hypothetical protein FJT64_017701 [Amphibalanus amphitrite]